MDGAPIGSRTDICLVVPPVQGTSAQGRQELLATCCCRNTTRNKASREETTWVEQDCTASSNSIPAAEHKCRMLYWMEE